MLHEISRISKCSMGVSVLSLHSVSTDSEYFQLYFILEMRTVYQMSGSTPVTSREKGGLQERRMESRPFSTLTPPTGASSPVK